jgi:hypothetical protein
MPSRAVQGDGEMDEVWIGHSVSLSYPVLTEQRAHREGHSTPLWSARPVSGAVLWVQGIGAR